MTKTKRRITQLFTAVVLASSAPAMAALEPMRLPTRAPAPGNVLSKGNNKDRDNDERRTSRKAEEEARELERVARAAVAQALRWKPDTVRPVVRAVDNVKPRKARKGTRTNIAGSPATREKSTTKSSTKI